MTKPGMAANAMVEPVGQKDDFPELVSAFTGTDANYYRRSFERIGQSTGFAWSPNPAAALLGPLWLGARSLWAPFWLAFILHLTAVVLLGIGIFSDLGADKVLRAEQLTAQSAERLAAAQKAEQANDPLAPSMKRSADAIARAAEKAASEAEAARAQKMLYVGGGIGLLVFVHLAVGIVANPLLMARFRKWRSDRTLPSGRRIPAALATFALMALSYPLAVYRFASADAPKWLRAFPADATLKNSLARAIDAAVTWTADSFSGFFASIAHAIESILNVAELALVVTPWPIVMLIIVAIAWQVTGRRVAVFVAAALAYLALLGFWEKSMATVALLGTASCLAIGLGIPLGIWCGRNSRVYSVVRPVLDFMQTMPAFVYLIPVIAFFGIGRPPGIIATLIFGMPPVVRLTALGLAGVPETVREAATAFGASRLFLLFKVDLPLAMPSIMAGVNQTLLMCLSMVVIASLIGSKGLGEDVLSALQYAAVGQGILAGFAILMCAMIIDRIVQGRS